MGVTVDLSKTGPQVVVANNLTITLSAADVFESVTGTSQNDQITGNNRWLAAVKQTGGETQPWSTAIDFTRVSDKNYFDDPCK